MYATVVSHLDNHSNHWSKNLKMTYYNFSVLQLNVFYHVSTLLNFSSRCFSFNILGKHLAVDSISSGVPQRRGQAVGKYIEVALKWWSLFRWDSNYCCLNTPSQSQWRCRPKHTDAVDNCRLMCTAIIQLQHLESRPELWNRTAVLTNLICHSKFFGSNRTHFSAPK